MAQEHPVSDFEFSFRWIPNNYAARIQRASVLYPLMGVANSTEDIFTKTAQLVAMWRMRATMLTKVGGWHHGTSDASLAYARNCCPSFAYAVPKSRPCNSVTICPFCWSRWVMTVWGRADAAFPNPRREAHPDGYHAINRVSMQTIVPRDLPATAPPSSAAEEITMHGRPLRAIELYTDIDEPTYAHHLIERFRIMSFPFEDAWNDRPPAEWLRHLMSQVARARATRMRRYNPHGAFSLATFVPTNQGWRLQIRELLMVRPSFAFSPATMGEWRVLRHERPTRRVVFHAVAHVCRYPKQLMFGDVHQTALLLNARRYKGEVPGPMSVIRLSAMYGAFRNNIT